MNNLQKGPRIVFMGSPEFALQSLKILHQLHNLVGVVTQPDRPAGRGKKQSSPAVKRLADELKLPVIQPSSLRNRESLIQLKAWQPDLIVVTAFGQILRKDVLDLPKHGCINVHASLLPRWRGAAPIQAAILHGDNQTGVSIMRMDEGLDTGPIISQKAIALDANERAGTLSNKLAELGAHLLNETVPGYISGDLKAQAQNDELSTYAPMLKKSDGELDFSMEADFLSRQVRAYHPWPGTFLREELGLLKIHLAHSKKDKSVQPGTKNMIDGLPAIAAKDGWLILDELQPAGKKPMKGADFLRGSRNWTGQIELTTEKEKA